MMANKILKEAEYPLEMKKEFEEKDWRELTNALKKMSDALKEIEIARRKNLTKTLNLLALSTTGNSHDYDAVAKLLAKDPEKQRLFLTIVAINRKAYEFTKHGSEYEDLIQQITNIIGKALVNS
jgi:hypothetical protein